MKPKPPARSGLTFWRCSKQRRTRRIVYLYEKNGTPGEIANPPGSRDSESTHYSWARALESSQPHRGTPAWAMGCGNGAAIWRSSLPPPPHPQPRQAPATPPNEKAPPRKTATGLSFAGARDRIRTGDPHVGNVMLYQLSYSCPGKLPGGRIIGDARRIVKPTPRGSIIPIRAFRSRPEPPRTRPSHCACRRFGGLFPLPGHNRCTRDR